MRISLDNFEDFISGSWDWDKEKETHTGIWIHPDSMDVSGGKITKAEIDRLAEYENKESLTISGLSQETFEYFIERYGKELRAVRFFKNKIVEDWSLLGNLPELEYVYWFHNQRITSLWDMSNNTALKGLCISDFTRLKSLDGINKAPYLEWFSMEDAVWDSTVVESYSCFAQSNVKYLRFGGKKIADGNLSFLSQMSQLECFDFASFHFETEKIAWVMANCLKVKGKSLNIFVKDWIYNKETGDYDIPALCVTGKGKRKFREDDIIKKEKLESEFIHMMENYRGKEYHEVF